MTHSVFDLVYIDAYRNDSEREMFYVHCYSFGASFVTEVIFIMLCSLMHAMILVI